MKTLRQIANEVANIRSGNNRQQAFLSYEELLAITHQNSGAKECASKAIYANQDTSHFTR